MPRSRVEERPHSGGRASGLPGLCIPESKAGNPRCCRTAADVSTTSVSPEVARVTEFGRDKVGEGLRTVVAPEGREPHSLRGDPRWEYDESTYGEVVESFRFGESPLAPVTGDQPVGERRAAFHYHETPSSCSSCWTAIARSRRA